MLKAIRQLFGGNDGGHARLRYSESGRAGAIRFQNSATSFDMYWEFGGGKAIVCIDVPPAAAWESATKLPLAERDSTLRFVAEQVTRDKISTPSRYEITDSWITIFER